jgi:hypothetical protein
VLGFQANTTLPAAKAENCVAKYKAKQRKEPRPKRPKHAGTAPALYILPRLYAYGLPTCQRQLTHFLETGGTLLDKVEPGNSFMEPNAFSADPEIPKFLSPSMPQLAAVRRPGK